MTPVAGDTDVVRPSVRGYELVARLGSARGIALWRGRGLDDGAAVLIQAAAVHAPRDPGPGIYLQRARDLLLAPLPGAAFARPRDLVTDEVTAALVLEDFPGDPLDQVLERGRVAPAVALRIGIHLADALGALHALQRIHGDLQPRSVLVTPQAERTILVDLGWAPRQEGGPVWPGLAPDLDADWAYLAPEQTGRMNRPVDHRADFYSLGILLYRVLTGVLPFQASGPLEWVHCHLARMPVPPIERLTSVPLMLSRVVMKLLAKLPEDRYQSAAGLAEDLGRCLRQWQLAGRVEEFTLGQRDVAERFQIPQRLFGRDAETAAILRAFSEVAESATPALVLVTGEAGSGKSSLVGELRRAMVAERTFFLAGKADPARRNMPFSSMVEAFGGLVEELLCESEPRLAEWRERIQTAVAPIGQVIIDAFPQVGAILGPQPPLADLPPAEARTRFLTAFQRFVSVFARPEHPVALFLDDLQWADSSDIELLVHLLAHPDTRHLLAIASHRPAEVGPGHRLNFALDDLRAAGVMIEEIPLRPFSALHVAQLLAETLRCPPAQVGAVATLIQSKTAGNPFFVVQFLADLHRDRLVWFDPQLRAWRWNEQAIAAREYTDNIVEMMIAKLMRLPVETQGLLTWAAWLGSQVDPETVGLVSGLSEDDVDRQLRVALREGLMGRRGRWYVFLHDRILQAAQALTPDQEHPRLQLRIGRLLAGRLAGDAAGEQLFEAANHYLQAQSLVVERQERVDLARLCLHAGQKAVATTAHAAAARFFGAGIALLEADDWTHEHQLAFDLHMGQAECQWLEGEGDQVMPRLAELLARAGSNLERIAVYRLRAQLHTHRGELREAVAAGLEAIRIAGVTLVLDTTNEEAARAIGRVWQRLGDRRIGDLLALPAMNDPDMQAAIAVAAAISSAAAFTGPNLLAVLASFMVEASLERGNAEKSAMGYALFASMMAVGGRHQEAYQFGKLGHDLALRQGQSATLTMVCSSLGVIVVHWVRPFQEALDYLEEGFRVGVATGDLLWTSYCCSSPILRWCAGAPVWTISEDLARRLDFLRRVSYQDVAVPLALLQCYLARVAGERPRPAPRLNASAAPEAEGRAVDIFDDPAFQRDMERLGTPRTIFDYQALRADAALQDGDFELAVAACEALKPHVGGHYGSAMVPEVLFVEALARAARLRSGGDAPVDAADAVDAVELAKVAVGAGDFRRWAEQCPENFAARAALLAAEVARLEGRLRDAEAGYEEAIRRGGREGHIRHQALACEAAARFHAGRGFPRIADAYLEEARSCHERWGAQRRVRQLEAAHPHLAATDHGLSGTAQAALAAAAGGTLDFLAVFEASRSISREIVLPRLLDTLMRTVLTVGGAERGALLTVQGEEMTVAAEARVARGAVTVDIPAAAGGARVGAGLPWSILNFARRNRERVILADAAADPSRFARDEQLTRRRPRSVLCLPILRHDTLTALLYLENTLVPNAFTAARLAALELLAAQAAVSLDNAELYGRLERENQERRRAEERFSRMFHASPAPMAVTRASDGVWIDANDSMLRSLGWTREEALGRTSVDLGILDAAQRERLVGAAGQAPRQAGLPPLFEAEVRTRTGERRIFLTCFETIELDGERCHLAGSVDVTERERAAEVEEQLRQSQKMEALGRLAGGVAHDFNNLLTVINGYGDLGQRESEPGQSAHGLFREILHAGEKAAALTHQLLAYSRNQKLAPQPWSLGVIVTDLEGMLRRLIGENVRLTTRVSAGAGQVMVDRGQIEQIIINLVINARDAMVEGGQLGLEVSEAQVEGAADVPPGRYVVLAISDTGRGMTEAVRARIFEPFFTTKEQGRGTGLGLSVVHGIVNQSGGYISVESEVNRGTVFRVHFPASDRQRPSAADPRRGPGDGTPSAHPSATILLVEDEDIVRRFATKALESKGYRVIAADNGRSALETLESLRGAVDLVVADVVMPEMGGPELARWIRGNLPALPVLFISGYTRNEALRQALEDAEETFLQKPFGPSDLIDKVRALLARSAASGVPRG